MQCNVPMEGGVARTTLEKLYFALLLLGMGRGGCTRRKCKQEAYRSGSRQTSGPIA